MFEISCVFGQKKKILSLDYDSVLLWLLFFFFSLHILEYIMVHLLIDSQENVVIYLLIYVPSRWGVGGISFSFALSQFILNLI